MRLQTITDELERLESQGKALAQQQSQFNADLKANQTSNQKIMAEQAQLNESYAALCLYDLSLSKVVSFSLSQITPLTEAAQQLNSQLEQLNHFSAAFNQLHQHYAELEHQGVIIGQSVLNIQHQEAMIQEKRHHNNDSITEQITSLEQCENDQLQIQKTLIEDVNASQILNILGTIIQSDLPIEQVIVNSDNWLLALQQQVVDFEQMTDKQHSLDTRLLAIEQAEILHHAQVQNIQEQVIQLQQGELALSNQLSNTKRLRVTYFESLGYTDKDSQSSDYIRKTLAKALSEHKAELLTLQTHQQAEQAKLQQLLGQEESAKKHINEIEQAQLEADNDLTNALEKSAQSLDELLEKLGSISLENIDVELEKLSEHLKHQQITLGKVQQAISHDQQSKVEQQTLLTQIALEQKNLDELSYLNNLIGSADGAKFRKFAQGLTLNHLVYLANEQLNKLDGRYQLQCQQGETLSLQVLDTWQADSIRDTKTLSGGESFLVSLALALALSDLVSSKTSIDSLFLDEGFGTLDNDTLEIALDALDNLNATGKMIGIISHVEALKERIAVQVKVEKQSGLGVSCLDKQFSFTSA